MKADKTLDCIGIYCPMPIVKTQQMMKTLEVGEVLEVIADDKGIKEDMPMWCQVTGNECLAIKNVGKEIKLYIKKKHE